jgi:N6-L-threonylcarbamoyladenine synthase
MIGRYALHAYEKKQFIDPHDIDIISTKKQQAGMLL